MIKKILLSGYFAVMITLLGSCGTILNNCMLSQISGVSLISAISVQNNHQKLAGAYERGCSEFSGSFQILDFGSLQKEKLT